MQQPATYPRYRRVLGSERQTLVASLAERYAKGESIRSLAESTNRSYGAIHRLLGEGGVCFRPRGGKHFRGKAKPGSAMKQAADRP